MLVDMRWYRGHVAPVHDGKVLKAIDKVDEMKMRWDERDCW
jgi:hypothetical protein